MTAADRFYILATWRDLQHLERARSEIDRARGLLTRAVECDAPATREFHRMLLDGAVDALAPAFAELAHTVRLLRIRAVGVQRRRAERLAARAAPLTYFDKTRTRAFNTPKRRR